MLCDVSDVGVRKSRTTTSNVAPRSTAAPVHHDWFEAGLAEITEQSTAGNAASGNEHLHLFVSHVIVFREDITLFSTFCIDVAKRHLIAQRSARSGVAREFDAVGSEHLTGAGNTAFAPTGSHTHASDVLQLVHRDIFAVAHGCQHLLFGDVFAVADIGGI